MEQIKISIVYVQYCNESSENGSPYVAQKTSHSTEFDAGVFKAVLQYAKADLLRVDAHDAPEENIHILTSSLVS